MFFPLAENVELIMSGFLCPTVRTQSSFKPVIMWWLHWLALMTPCQQCSQAGCSQLALLETQN